MVALSVLANRLTSTVPSETVTGNVCTSAVNGPTVAAISRLSLTTVPSIETSNTRSFADDQKISAKCRTTS